MAHNDRVFVVRLAPSDYYRFAALAADQHREPPEHAAALIQQAIRQDHAPQPAEVTHERVAAA